MGTILGTTTQTNASDMKLWLPEVYAKYASMVNEKIKMGAPFGTNTTLASYRINALKELEQLFIDIGPWDEMKELYKHNDPIFLPNAILEASDKYPVLALVLGCEYMINYITAYQCTVWTAVGKSADEMLHWAKFDPTWIKKVFEQHLRTEFFKNVKETKHG